MLSNHQIEQLHRKYAPNDKVFELVYTHCQIVNEIAQWCAGRIDDEVDTELLRVASLLHDIGTYIFFNEEGKVPNRRLYPLHAILGAKMVADEGIDKRVSEIIETHVLLGLSKQEIIDKPLILPAKDYVTTSIEGEILCFADRFHSKKPVFNAYDTFLDRLKNELPIQAEKFEALSEKFGLPDIERLAKKYKHPIK